jgi:hypothetical protein
MIGAKVVGLRYRKKHRFTQVIPAYAGYAAAGSSLYVGECCKQLVGELATHVYGHARMPITTWLHDNTTESLAHAQEAVR